jgi:hypothetical protein
VTVHNDPAMLLLFGTVADVHPMADMKLPSKSQANRRDIPTSDKSLE